MIRKEIVYWFTNYRKNLLKPCAPAVLPFTEDYVYKNALGIKFFMVKKSLTGIWNIKTPDEQEVKLKEVTIIEEIYFIDYDAYWNTMTYVYAKDVDSGAFDIHNGLAIDLTKIPKNTVSGIIGGFNYYDDNVDFLTLEELFVRKDIL